MEEEKVNRKFDVFRILSDLVNIPSYGTVGKDNQIIKYLKDYFKSCYELRELNDKNGNTHLLVGVNHELKNIDNAILFSGHIDTVFQTEGHNCNISMENGVLKGLGVSDMKSFIATLLANLEYLKNLDIPIVISLTSDEETRLLGIHHIIQELENRNINANMIIVGEPTNLDYYVSSRGNSIYVSVMNGITCHSGTPELGVNAIESQARFVMEIIKIKEQYLKDAAVCITHIDGGKTPSNVVPDFSSTCFGIRTSNSKLLNTMYNYLIEKHKEISKDYGESKLFNVLSIPPFERKESEFLNQQIKENGKNKIDAKYATEAGYFQMVYPQSDIVIYGPGNPDNIHKPGEFLDPNNLLKYEVELKKLLENYLGYINYKFSNDMSRKLIYNKTDSNK